MEGDIQFVADTFLIERTFQILAEAEQGEGPLRKYAQDLGSLLGTLKGGIESFVQQNIDTSSPGGTARTVVNLLAPAVFFRLHPILGILVTAGKLFGIDLYSIFGKIAGVVTSLIQKGQPVTAAQVNEAAKAALPTPTEVTAELLDSLYDLHKNGELEAILKKEAVSSNPFAEFFGQQTTKNESPLIRMFSFLGPRRGSNLLVGILSWFIKTILMSAGMLAVGGMAASALGFHPTGTAENSRNSGSQTGGQSALTPAAGVNVPAPTGAGAWNFRPNPNDIWVEYLNGDQPYQRVVDWAIQSYPSLNQYQDIIVRTPSFWNVVRGLTGDWRPGQSQWAIPKPYKSKNEILALFIPDVYRTIQQQQ